MIKHIRRWNKWRKYNRNGAFYKFLVLIGFVKSPTMKQCLLPEEQKKIHDAFMEAFIRGNEIIKAVEVYEDKSK